MANKQPGNLEAERSVLGAMLLSESAASIALASLNEESFNAIDVRNAYVFRAMKLLGDKGASLDIQTVHDQLTTMQLAAEVHSPEYLLELAESAINPENTEYYINIVRDYEVLRAFFKEADDAKKAFSAGKVDDIGDFLSSYSHSLTAIANRRSVASFLSSGDVATQMRMQLKKFRDLGGKRLTGLDTGYPILNNLTHGFQPGSLNIIAARPSIGKTTFAVNLAYNAAISSTNGGGKVIAFFSCEMPSVSIMQKLCSAISLVPYERIQMGNLSDTENKKVLAALNTLSALNIFYDDTPNQQLGDILAKSDKLYNTYGDKLGGIFIDYLNIITTPNLRASDSRAIQIGQITSALKNMARKLNVPVICLAQINRNADDNKGRDGVTGAPTLNQLKESSSIEQDADLVIMLHRKDYQKSETEVDATKPQSKSDALRAQIADDKAHGRDKNDTSVVDIYIRKNRLGRLDNFSLLFEKTIQRFSIPSMDFTTENVALNND